MSAGRAYRAYLLRLWCEAEASWRASLDDPHTGHRQAFASLDQLADYLAQGCAAGFAAAEPPPLAPAGRGAGEPPGAED